MNAIFQNGVFRPIESVGPEFAEGQQVRLLVETPASHDVLSLAGAVYEGLSPAEQDEIERLALARSHFWSQ